jgi:hypothetical protein
MDENVDSIETARPDAESKVTRLGDVLWVGYFLKRLKES